MKKNLVLFAIVFFAFGCGESNDKESKSKTESSTPVEDITKNPVYTKGVELISKSGCLACHKVSEKLVGPSYESVAEKYSEKDIDYLVEKIMKGGKGVWGEVPMTPNPQLKEEDAKQIIQYILLLKK